MITFLTSPEETIRLMTPFIVGAMFALPLLMIALYLRGVLRHVKYQTALIEGRIRPARAPATVDDLDAARRRREAAE